MKQVKIITIPVFVLLAFLTKSNAQELLIPKSNTEFMCVPVESISDFDNSNQFYVGDNEILNDNQVHLNATIQVIAGGVGNTKCLELSITDVASKGGTCFLKCENPPMLNENEGIGMWFKSTSDVQSDIYFEDSAGLVFHIPKKFIEGNTDWSYAFTMPNSYRLSNESERANPSITYPCKFLGVSLLSREEGTFVYLDEIEKVKELDRSIAPEFSVTPQKIGNVYNIHEKVEANIISVASMLLIKVMDYKGNIIEEKIAQKSMKYELPTDHQGYFEILVLSYKDKITDENLVNGKVFSYSVLRDKTIFNDKLGVCAHPQRDYYSRSCVDLMSIVGAKYMRFGMVLEFLEKEDGTFEFEDNTLDILNNAREKGFKYVCVFRDKTPPLTEERKEKFLKFSRFLLDEYKNVIDKVEFWNEWTNGTGTHFQFQKEQTAENYTKFVRSVYPVLKAEYPEVEFIGLGGENPQRFREHILDMYEAGAGKYMDAISLHPYRQPVVPDSRAEKVHNLNMAEQVLDIVDISKKYNGPEKVYITEIGYSTHLLNWGISEYMQAENVVKTIGILLSSNVVEQVDWYNLYNMLGDQPTRTYTRSEEYSQYNFCMFNGEKYNFAIKPSAMAFRFFAKITNGFSWGEQFEDGNGLVRLSMLVENDTKLNILWNDKSQTDYEVLDGYKAYDLMGNPIENNGRIKLGREPIYLLKSAK